jgi:hypothetical protein
VIKEYGLKYTIDYFTLDNAYNNNIILQTLAKALPNFNAKQRRLRYKNHIINFTVQTFMVGKNKNASDDAIRQIAKLSKEEIKGSRDRIETAEEWRKLEALGMFHNLVIYIRLTD